MPLSSKGESSTNPLLMPCYLAILIPQITIFMCQLRQLLTFNRFDCNITHGFFHWEFLIVFNLLVLVNGVSGQSELSKTIVATALEHDKQLILDGRIDDEIWKKSLGVTDFRMQVPVEGNEPTLRTEVFVAYDENNLYIAVDLKDDEPSKIKSFQKRRDNDFETDDRFQWILDTFKDGRNAYYFAINPAGAMRDGLLTIGQGTSLNINWDGIWRVWTHVNAEGWTAEIRIPFITLNFDPGLDSWGINFQRTIRRSNEEVVWSGHQRNLGLLRPQNAGTLSGLINISQGLGLETKPYAAIRRRQVSDEEITTTEYEGDFGMDVNYNITPGLKASITYNTDFAETDVDDRRINLTRFPLFFPEKRSFFLEGSNIYSFAPTSGIRPYFSRRIGLSSGQAIPIDFGARLVGRVDKYDVAFQHVMTGSQDDVSKEHFTVARVKRNVGRESRIGLVYTRRSTNSDEDIFLLNDRHTIGADLELNTSQFLGDKNFQFQAFFVYHNQDSPLNESNFWDRTSRGIRFNFPNRPWYGHTSYREFGTEFDPAVGFHPRVGFRRFQPSVGFNPLFEKSKVIRDIDFGIRFEHLMDMDWKLLTQVLRFDLFEITFESAERFGISISRNFERLTEDFDILGDNSIVIPQDDYANWGIGFEFATASFRKISLRVDIESAGFWSGTQTELGSALTFRPTPGINLTTTFVHTEIDLVEGSFSTDLVRFNASYDISPFLSFSSFIQWDNLSNELGLNNRFRWILSPGNDLFIVYNHNWEERTNRWRTLNGLTTMKASYTHRF